MAPSPPARATIGIVGVTILAWLVLLALGRGDWAAFAMGFVPARISGAGASVAGAVPAWLTPLSATLVHSGIAHIGFNLLLIGFCGRFVELALGARGLLLLYLLGAYAAAAAQFAVAPFDPTPMVGASGAGSALLGTYAILYGTRSAAPRAGLSSGLLNALWLAAAWIGLQVLTGVAMRGEGMAIAIAAHIGGFIAGLLFARPLLRLRYRS